MKIAVPAEAEDTRVAATPDVVKRYVNAGAEVAIESGAGADSRVTDEAYREAGATIADSAEAAVSGADIILTVRRPSAAVLGAAKRGAFLIGALDPYGDADGMKAIADAGLAAVAMELMPRITRAQSMDILSSQANLAGYQAVIDAASVYDRAIPMMMTAAGTVPAAKIFVMGAGVAGLQAIATARRLGGAVSATDVRPAAKEQVASLGAKFIAVENEEFKAAETAGGYAKEMSEDYRRQQAELVAAHIAKQDIVITTALIPGRPAPKLISAAMVASMNPGSVIVDLAVERGGNVEGAVPGDVVTVGPTTIIGHTNMQGRIAASASLLYAKNLYTFIDTVLLDKEKAFAPKWDDELMTATLLTKDGGLVHPKFGGTAPATAAPQAASSAG
ncbi:Re/Si-specific NAD(P)(+) transhydrogenase subunit alpha [Acuticoccus sp. I52.16.1]|uniref:Re/Si-specific NAD(P)(+) transhydrogenase subunit alpha n=1 Tax=Acuticoccus sp. I52.16.1 TaxID=2928472 RepID=UPI001FD1C00C|nr:Re/Si-specific NAD(P)(+) transhydrogenase subunit alpha [Acuticoccus sp. I52.16.1]UOM33799.1 Re/Si-specific NAD(P)(+) transhydrogenase subunit alpha [Acuticoccus sp. I52.16.1]